MNQDRGGRGRPHYHSRGGGGPSRGYHQGAKNSNRGGNNQAHSGHQRSFVGHKRGREDTEADERKALIALLMELGDKPQGTSESVLDAGVVDEAVKLCKREISNKNDTMVELLLDCVVEMSPKTPIYALLIGLINVDEPHFCGDLVDSAATMVTTCLASPSPADHDRARLLLRLLCCLAAANVLRPSGCTNLLEAMVDAAKGALSEGLARSQAWQPWSDWLVYCAAAALPWGGSEMSAACPTEFGRLMESVEAYLEKRPSQSSQELRPFLSEIKENDLAAKSDSGGASFLIEFWAAVKECAASSNWNVVSIPQVLSSEHGGSQYSSRLAMGQTHDLPQVTVPRSPAGLPSEDQEGPSHPLQEAAAVLQAYPPHGGIRLLDSQHTEAGRPAIERLVAIDCIIDTLAAFDVNRMQCIKRLVSGLMLPYSYTNLLGEVLFGQMLALPRPRLPAMAYCTIMVDLCKLPRLEFPKALSGCVRECFARVPVMDPELRTRLLTWLSYHLSNFEYQWPWDRWARYVDEPEDNAHRQFCKELVARLIRLSWWDRVQQVLPPKFQQLLGPMPEVPLLPNQEGPQQQQQQQQKEQQKVAEASGSTEEGGKQGQGGGGDGDGGSGDGHKAGGEKSQDEGRGTGGMDVEGGDSRGDRAEGAGNEEGGEGEKGGDTDMVPSGGEGNSAGGNKRGAEKVIQYSVDEVLAGEMLRDVVRAKASPEALLEWMGERGVEGAVGEGPQGMVKVLMRALLAAGSKSPTHLNVALERYASAMKELISSSGLPGQVVAVELAAQFYSALPQKVLMVLDRLLALGLLGAEAVSDWAFHSSIPATLSKQASASSAWEVLHYSLERSSARLPEAQEKVAKATADEALVRKKVHALQDQADHLAGQLRSHAAQQRQQQQKEDDAGDALQQGGRDIEGMPLEELATEPRGRKLLAGQRDAIHRASVFSAKADALGTTLEHHRALLEAAGPARDVAMLAAYRGFLQLVTAEEESACVQPMEEEDGGDEAARAARVRQARLDHLYAQLRAFVRKYLSETAAIAPQVAQELSSRSLPARAMEVFREVLKCEL